MRCLKKNQQKMFYGLQCEQVPIYETDIDGNIVFDHYTDGDGNEIYYLDENGEKIPLPTGETLIAYDDAVEFSGNIAMSGGEAEAKEYGIDVSNYDAILIVEKKKLPIDETAVIWLDSVPQQLEGTINLKNYPSNEEMPDKQKYLKQKYIDGKTADFRVLAVKQSLNSTKYVLGRITK